MPRVKVKEFESMAREMVGDGKSPDLFFVSQEGVIITVTRDFETAYNEWRHLSRKIETCLENRTWGVICTTEPREEGSDRLATYDDAWLFAKEKGITLCV